jgi:hypothetical protein
MKVNVFSGANAKIYIALQKFPLLAERRSDPGDYNPRRIALN